MCEFKGALWHSKRARRRRLSPSEFDLAFPRTLTRIEYVFSEAHIESCMAQLLCQFYSRNMSSPECRRRTFQIEALWSNIQSQSAVATGYDGGVRQWTLTFHDLTLVMLVEVVSVLVRLPCAGVSRLATVSVLPLKSARTGHSLRRFRTRDLIPKGYLRCNRNPVLY